VRYGVAVVLVLEALLLYYFLGKYGRHEGFKRVYLPEVHEIARLRELNKIEKLPQCTLPPLPKGVSPVIAAGPNFNFTISVRPDWRRTAIDTGSVVFPDSQVTFSDKRGHNITISRVADGGMGRSFMADTLGHPLPADECEVSKEKAGSIWSFYPAKSDTARLKRRRYFGLADAMTSSGKRFKFSIGAPSPEERDSLAAVVAQAVFRQ